MLKGRRDLGGSIPGTLEAWLALRGLRTLHLRVERAQANARELVAPARGAPPRSPRSATRASGGSSRSCWPAARRRRPAGAQHPALGCTPPAWAASSRPSSDVAAGRRSPPTIPDGLVRLSVGIEDVEDLWADLVRALAPLA